MNATEQKHYAKGLTRAADRGIEVVGVGHTRDGRQVYCTTSGSEQNRWHLVVVEGAHLMCDCKAAQNGRYCCHRAAVSARIAREHAPKPAPVAAPTPASTRPAHETAPLHRDNRGFSIWK